MQFSGQINQESMQSKSMGDETFQDQNIQHLNHYEHQLFNEFTNIYNQLNITLKNNDSNKSIGQQFIINERLIILDQANDYYVKILTEIIHKQKNENQNYQQFLEYFICWNLFDIYFLKKNHSKTEQFTIFISQILPQVDLSIIPNLLLNQDQNKKQIFQIIIDLLIRADYYNLWSIINQLKDFQELNITSAIKDCLDFKLKFHKGKDNQNVQKVQFIGNFERFQQKITQIQHEIVQKQVDGNIISLLKILAGDSSEILKVVNKDWKQLIPLYYQFINPAPIEADIQSFLQKNLEHLDITINQYQYLQIILYKDFKVLKQKYLEAGGSNFIIFIIEDQLIQQNIFRRRAEQQIISHVNQMVDNLLELIHYFQKIEIDIDLAKVYIIQLLQILQQSHELKIINKDQHYLLVNDILNAKVFLNKINLEQLIELVQEFQQFNLQYFQNIFEKYFSIQLKQKNYIESIKTMIFIDKKSINQQFIQILSEQLLEVCQNTNKLIEILELLQKQEENNSDIQRIISNLSLLNEMTIMNQKKQNQLNAIQMNQIISIIELETNPLIFKQLIFEQFNALQKLQKRYINLDQIYILIEELNKLIQLNNQKLVSRLNYQKLQYKLELCLDV